LCYNTITSDVEKLKDMIHNQTETMQRLASQLDKQQAKRKREITRN